MKGTLRIVLSLLVLNTCFSLVLTPDANADVVIKEKVKYYNVTGSNGREIFKSMLANGPKLGGPRGGHALATTEYDYDVKNIDVEIIRGRCIAKDLDVEVRVKYTYPRWRGSRKASNETRSAWRNFDKAVKWHEKQHVKIATEYAKDYEKVLRKMRLRTSSGCGRSSLSARIRATSAALRHNRKQKMFDRRDLRPGGRGYKAQLRLMNAR